MGVPSFITVETEDGSWIGEKDAQKTEKRFQNHAGRRLETVLYPAGG